MHEFAVPPDAARTRLDQFLATALPHLTRSRIQALIKSGHVTLNGAQPKSSDKLRSGDLITLHEPPPEPVDTLPQHIPLDIIFEDDDLLVINKPAGLVVHPAVGNLDGTLVNALLHHCRALSGIGGKERPGIVHRLDKETSGCIVVARTDQAHQALSQQFAGREVEKEYLALAEGFLPRPHLLVEKPIGRHPVHRQRMAVLTEGHGRTAKTEFFVLKQLACGSLLRCVLHTGRTHQIRVHLKHLGHPVLGDKIYGRTASWPRHMLHAWKLAFNHPHSAERVRFTASIPDDFIQAGVEPDLK